MKINIYTKIGSFGLHADAEILRNILINHECHIIDWRHPINISNADIGIHLERISNELINFSPYNISVPNLGWFESSFIEYLGEIDAIFCKTQCTYDVFKTMHINCIFCGWTSKDMFLPKIEKQPIFMHLAGGSENKGSKDVLDAWLNNESFPMLHFQKIYKIKNFQSVLPNVTTQFQRIDDIRPFMNQSLFHLCPSKIEGFGHYINEALSTGAIVITTDAPPMNELVTSDYGFLVKADVCGELNSSPLYQIDQTDFIRTLNDAMNTPIVTLLEMSNKARDSFLKRDTDFKVLINELIDAID